MRPTRRPAPAGSTSLAAVAVLIVIAACSSEAGNPLSGSPDAAALAAGSRALSPDCVMRGSEVAASVVDDAREQGALCENGPFAESARPVVNGQYADAWQIHTVGFSGAGNYITTQPYTAADPDWDRSGRRIYYWAITDGPDGIFWVPAEGGPSTQIAMEGSNDPDYLGDDRPCISPSGRELLTERAFGPISEEGIARLSAIFKSRIDGTHPLQVSHPGVGFEDHSARWSPLGRRVVFQRLDENTGLSALWIVNADGTKEHRISPDGFDGSEPDWSPDGDVIVYASPADPDPVIPQRLYTIRPDGSHIVELTHGLADPTLTVKTYHARFSPDGRMIVFGHVDAHTTLGPDGLHHGDLFVIARDGSGLTQVTHSPDAENAPAWGPRRH